MRIILVTLGSLFISFLVFWTIKFWGRSQTYVDYQHPLYTAAALSKDPVLFIKPSFENLEAALKNEPNLYLDILSTEDGHLVIGKKHWDAKLKPVRYAKYEDIKNDVILISDLKDLLPKKKIIFNILENAQAGHMIFFDEIKKANLQKGENFIVTSPYEAMAKSLKDVAPAYLYGTTQPEILKITAMRAMHLLEALNLRADAVIYPLSIRNQKFYDDELIAEMKKRHKRIIVGPISEADLAEAKALNPFGIILNK